MNADNQRAPARSNSAAAGLEQREVWKGLVFRPQKRMLNGTGPVSLPMRTLYVDGSEESQEAYGLCDEHDIDFGVQIVEPGTQVVLHDHVLHLDFCGLDRIRVGIDAALRLHEETQSLLNAAIPLAMRERSRIDRQTVQKSLDAERVAREQLMHQAIECYAEHRPQSTTT